MAEDGNTKIAYTLLIIINIALPTLSPLKRWQHSSQIMIKRAKANFVENLCIIQLCEAELNFVLNILWGNRMIHTTQKHGSLDDSQFSIPGHNTLCYNDRLWCSIRFHPTCNVHHNMLQIWHATNSFYYFYNLLHKKEFYIITGLGETPNSFTNDEDPSRPGQGMLQGSSSVGPIYNVNSDVSLTTYWKSAFSAAFTHPITKEEINDHMTQYINDKIDMYPLPYTSLITCWQP